ncbi:MAG: DUF2628 domain-containing protein [Alphaproteobacteria bacterium]|nr:DUF2628 domain-containing protein [Alphaproteobacteria bacterium]
MRVWTVHLRPALAGKPARTVIVREGFSWWAALFPLLWFLAKRLWIVAALYFALATLLGFVLPSSISPWAMVALQILAGFEARNLQRWALERQGFRLMGVVQGRNEDGAVLNLADRRPDLAQGLA